MDKFKKYFGDKSIFKSDEEIKKNTERLFKEIKNIFPTKCIYANGCDKKPINSHSIQSSRTLKALSNNKNKVGLFSGSVDPFEGVSFQVKEVGINKATTFLGLCSEHDNKTFEPIEKKDFSPDDLEQLFKYCYRTVLRQYYVLNQIDLRWRKKVNEMDKKDDFKVVLFLSNSYMAYINLFNFSKIKNVFDLAELTGNFDRDIIFNVRELDEVLPIAVSSAFTPTYDFKNNLINDYKDRNVVPIHVCLTVFPENNKTYVILGHLKHQDKALVSYVNQFMKEPDIYDILSETIFRHIENFVINPDYWNSISKDRKENIIKFFEQTLHRDVERDKKIVYKSDKHNLFQQI